MERFSGSSGIRCNGTGGLPSGWPSRLAWGNLFRIRLWTPAPREENTTFILKGESSDSSPRVTSWGGMPTGGGAILGLGEVGFLRTTSSLSPADQLARMAYSDKSRTEF